MFCLEAATAVWARGYRHHALAEWVLRATSVPWTELDEIDDDDNDASASRDDEGCRSSLLDRRLSSFLSSPSTGALADLFDGGVSASGEASLPFHESGVDFGAAFVSLQKARNTSPSHRNLSPQISRDPIHSSECQSDLLLPHYKRCGSGGYMRLCAFVGSFHQSELRAELYRELAALLPLPDSSFDEFCASLPPARHEALIEPKDTGRYAGQAVRSYFVWMNLAWYSASFAHLSDLFSCALTWRGRLLQMDIADMRPHCGRLSCAARKAQAVEEAIIERNVNRCQIAIHNCFEEPPRRTLVQQIAAVPSKGGGELLAQSSAALRLHGFASNIVPIHQALACGTLATAGMFLALGSSREALQCSELAIVNGHQAANVADETLPLSHHMKMLCHVAIGDVAAAAEDASISLQLAGTHAERTPLLVQVLCNTLLSSASLLVHNTAAVDRSLRSAIMQIAGGQVDAASSTEDPAGGSSGPAGDDRDGATAVMELVQTIPQTLHAVQHAVEWLALMHLEPLAQRCLALQRDVLAFSAFGFGCASLAPHVVPLAEAAEHDAAAYNRSMQHHGASPMMVVSRLDLASHYVKYSFWRVLLDVQEHDGHLRSVSDLQCLIRSVTAHFGGKYSAVLTTSALLRHVVILEIGVGLGREGYQAAAYDVFSDIHDQVLQEAHFRGVASPSTAAAGPTDSKLPLPCWSIELLTLLTIAVYKRGEAALYLALQGTCREMCDLLERVGSSNAFTMAIAYASLLRALLLQHERHYVEGIALLVAMEGTLSAAGHQHFLCQLRLRLGSLHISRGDDASAVSVLRQVEQSACSAADWRLRQSLVLSCEVRQDREAACRRARRLLSSLSDATPRRGRLDEQLVLNLQALKVLPVGDPLYQRAAKSVEHLRATIAERHRAQTVAVLPTAARSSLSELCALAVGSCS